MSEPHAWLAPADSDLLTPADAVRLAECVRRVGGHRGRTKGALADLEAILHVGRFDLEREPLMDEGLEALLVPRAGDRFGLIVDPRPACGWRARSEGDRATERQRLRFRIGHEIAHSFFYDRSPTEYPTRRVADSPAQESFCDAFASALLVPPAAVAAYGTAPEAVLRAQRAFDVSLEVATRGFARAFPTRPFALLYSDQEGELRPQWIAPSEALPPRWWAADTVRTLARAGYRSTRSFSLRLGEHIAQGLWIGSRRQVLLSVAA